MELGSAEHKQRLTQGILRVAVKTALLGLIVGVIMIIPMVLRQNTFSLGLAYGGFAIIIGSQLFATVLAWKKYQKIIKPFDKMYNSDKENQD